MSDTIVVAGSILQDQLIGPQQVTMYGDDIVVIAYDGTDITPVTDATVEAAAAPIKNVKIQSPEHILLLKGPPRQTCYGPEINLV